MYNGCARPWTCHVAWSASCDNVMKPGVSLTLNGQVDLSKEYWNDVFEPSLRMWEVGHTPNPDVWCNRLVNHFEA